MKPLPVLEFFINGTNVKDLALQYQLAYNTAMVQTKDVPVAIRALVSKKVRTFEKL